MIGPKTSNAAIMMAALILLSIVNKSYSSMMSEAMGSVTNVSENSYVNSSPQHDDGEILLEKFVSNDSLHSWNQMNDPVMGGKSTGSFKVEQNSGVMDGHVAIVPFLHAPGFIKAETSAGEAWPDISSCSGLRLRVKAPGDYTGYRVSFGHQHPPNGFPYSYGYKTDLHLSGLNEMEDIVLNFNEFSYDWDAATGDQKTTCAENPDNCPSTEALQDIYSISLWAEGVEGDALLVVESIYAVGCDDSSSYTKENMDPVETNKSTHKQKDVRTQNDVDEIIIEDFNEPMLDWNTLNDPVMGGQSDSEVSINDGVALFTGHVKVVPFLHAPGFITMASTGGNYPDVSSCDALKLVLNAQGAYSGYYVSFGTAHVDGDHHAFGFKTPFDAPVQDAFSSIVLPFSSFSDNWDDATGHVKVSCEEDPQYCPDILTLQNFKTISIWGEGVEGTINLAIQSISAVGCGTNAQVEFASKSASTTTRSLLNFPYFTSRVGIAAIGTILATTIILVISRKRNKFIAKQYMQIESEMRLEVEEGCVIREIN